jgi:hypothetical protein
MPALFTCYSSCLGGLVGFNLEVYRKNISCQSLCGNEKVLAHILKFYIAGEVDAGGSRAKLKANRPSIPLVSAFERPLYKKSLNRQRLE